MRPTLERCELSTAPTPVIGTTYEYHEELERETRPELALHHLDSSTFSPLGVTPMYLMMTYSARLDGP
jgi:hypothetical protein